MTTQKFCYLYDGSEEQRVAYEVWDGIRAPTVLSPKDYEGEYLSSDGDPYERRLNHTLILRFSQVRYVAHCHFITTTSS